MKKIENYFKAYREQKYPSCPVLEAILVPLLKNKCELDKLRNWKHSKSVFEKWAMS